MEAEVKQIWEKKAQKRFNDTISDVKRSWLKKRDAGEMLERPGYMSEAYWAGIQEYWMREDVQRVAAVNSRNRNSEPDGPGTGRSMHAGGSRSTQVVAQQMVSKFFQ
jgi:uncharacterized protein